MIELFTFLLKKSRFCCILFLGLISVHHVLPSHLNLHIAIVILITESIKMKLSVRHDWAETTHVLILSLLVSLTYEISIAVLCLHLQLLALIESTFFLAVQIQFLIVHVI